MKDLGGVSSAAIDRKPSPISAPALRSSACCCRAVRLRGVQSGVDLVDQALLQPVHARLDLTGRQHASACSLGHSAPPGPFGRHPQTRSPDKGSGHADRGGCCHAPGLRHDARMTEEAPSCATGLKGAHHVRHLPLDGVGIIIYAAKLPVDLVQALLQLLDLPLFIRRQFSSRPGSNGHQLIGALQVKGRLPRTAAA